MRSRTLGLLVLLAMVAAGCGARVGRQQALAEGRQEARRLGLTGGVAAGGQAQALDQAQTLDTSAGSGGATAGGAGSAGGTGGGASTRRTATGGGGSGGGGASGGGASAASGCSGGGSSDVGVTGNEIKLGNVSTLTGPVPGLFRGALVGTQAFAAYVNSQGGICGRKLTVVPGDDALDSGKNRAAHLQLKDQVFSFVGSFSVSDDGGVDVLQQCACPDVGGALSRSRFALPNHYDVQPAPHGWRTGGLNYYKQKFSNDVITRVAFFVSAIESARDIAKDERAVMESLGYKVVYTREVAPNETNFTGDIIQMRNNGVRALIWQGDVGNMARLASTMRQQNFTVDLPNWGNAMYDQSAFTLAGADALEGTYLDQVYAMFQGEDASLIPEVALFDQWMRRVDPRQPVDLYSLYGWVSGRLFTEAATKVGPQLTRQKLLQALSQMGQWDANQMIAPINVGQKKPSDCVFIFRIKGGKFVREFPTDKPYACDLGGYKYLQG